MTDLFLLYNMRKKILINTYKNPFEYKWGMEVCVKNIALALSKDYSVICTYYMQSWEEKNTKIIAKNIQCIWIPTSKYMGLAEIIYAYRINKFTKDYWPDLVIDNTCVSFLNNTKNNKTISIIHWTSFWNYSSIRVNTFKKSLQKIYRLWWAFLQYTFLRRVFSVIAISKKMKEEIICYYKIVLII